jgi:predicted cupin superfamily sugar epimerase
MNGREVSTHVNARPATAEALDLAPHPEGGWYRQTWRSEVLFHPPGYPGERSTCTAIYFLLCPGEESCWHVVRSAELWLWHRGGPLTLNLGGGRDQPDAQPSAVVLGPDLSAGQQPQVLIPPGTWQSASPATDEEVLVSCVVSPGFDFSDFRMQPPA